MILGFSLVSMAFVHVVRRHHLAPFKIWRSYFLRYANRTEWDNELILVYP